MQFPHTPNINSMIHKVTCAPRLRTFVAMIPMWQMLASAFIATCDVCYSNKVFLKSTLSRQVNTIKHIINLIITNLAKYPTTMKETSAAGQT
jgi:hypothetical protein